MSGTGTIAAATNGTHSDGTPAAGGEQSVPPRGWIRLLLTALRPHRRDVWIAVGAAGAGQLIAALAPLVQRHIIDDGIVAGTAPIAPWIAVLILAGVVRFAAAFVRRFWAGRVSLDVQNDLRTQVYDHLQRLDVARHDQMATGQLVSRSISDINLIQGLLAFLPIVVANLLFFVVALIVMASISPLLTVVALAISPALLITSFRLRTSVFPANWDAQQQTGVVAGVVEETVSGVRVVKGFGQEEREVTRLAAAADALYGRRVRTIRLQARYQPFMQALPALGQVAVLGLGGWLAIEGRITLGTFLAFSTYVGKLQAPARMLAGLVTIGQQARAGVERVFELLDSTPAVQELPGAPDLLVTDGEVVLDGVTFGYLSTEPVLDRLSLRVAPGETMALVGTSGSGKSTLAGLLPRFYDVQGGAIRIDGTDVSTVTLDSLRRSIGLVFEDSFLFSDTIRGNIAYGRPDATDAEVERAARTAGADGFVTELADGYDTAVGERGLMLSGGQRQRIALARAILTDPKVLVLDDATSAVDSRIEAEIHATLHEVLEHRTTVLIAHRRSTLQLADRIAVLDAGRVVDVGTHAELEERCPLYRVLLSGPGDDAEGADAPVPTATDGAGAGNGSDKVSNPLAFDPDRGVTPGLWRRTDGPGASGADARDVLAAAGRKVTAAPSLGAGMAGGGGSGSMLGGLAPTPELLAKVEALPPPDDRPDLPVAEARREDPSFGFVRFLRPWRWQLAVGLTLVVLDGLATLAGPVLVRHGIDAGVTPAVTGALWATTLAYLLVVLADLVVMIFQTFITGRTAERVLYALRVRIFAHLQRLGLDYYDREMGGRIMTRMTSDIEALTQLLQTGLVNALVSLLTCLGVGVVLLVMNWQLGLLAMLVVPPLAVGTMWFRRLSAQAYDEARDRVAVVNADFQESLSGVRVAQAYVREDRNTERFAGLTSAYLRARLRAQRLVATYFPFVEMLSEVAAAIVLAGGAVLIDRGSLSAGELIAFLLYLDLFFSPIQQLSQVFDTYQQARVALARIGDLLATPSNTPEADDPVIPERLTGRVTFEDVRFAYPTTGVEVLHGIDLTIAPGETVAIVGETGAGKSTVEKLVARYYDVSGGRVCIDGIDVRDLDLAAYRHQLGVVPQEAFLFAGTVRDNVAYGRPDATDADVEAAARAVGAHDVVASLPGGYLHVIGEQGRSLSSGQRQLLALARARLVDPAILLLDEATSNLDLATEARVAAAMGITAQGRTTLVIAHRLSTAMTADRVVVMDGGRVVQVGTHEDLLAVPGRYAELWAAFQGESAAA